MIFWSQANDGDHPRDGSDTHTVVNKRWLDIENRITQNKVKMGGGGTAVLLLSDLCNLEALQCILGVESWSMA